MEPNSVLPEYIKKALAKHEIWPVEVRAAFYADRTLDGEYADFWLVVTRDSLVVLRGAFPGEQVKLFAGFRVAPEGKSTRRKKTEPGWQAQSWDLYPVARVDKIWTESLVSGGILGITMDGADQALCCYSSSCACDMSALVKYFEKIKAGKEPEPGDILHERAQGFCPKCGLVYPEQDRNICPNCLDKRSVFLRLLSYTTPYKKQIIIILFCMLLNVALNLVSPYLMGSMLFDQVLAQGGRFYGQVGLVIVLAVLSKILAQGVGILYGRINSVVTAEVIFRLKTDIFSAMQRHSLSFYNKKQTGSLMTRVNEDTHHVQYFFHDGLPYFIVNAVMILGIGIIMAVMNWRLALLVLIPAPFLLVYLKKMFPRLWQMYHRRWRAESKMSSLINDTLRGMRVVKAFGKENEEIRRFHGANRGIFGVDLNIGNFTSSMFPLMWFFMTIGSLIVWGVGGWDVMAGRVTFGTLVMFVVYIDMIYGPLQFMTQIVDWWSHCMNASQRIFEIIDATPEVAESPRPVRMPELKGDLRLEHVTFAYEPNKPVLHDISLELKSGEMLGIVGRSGAGKTTIANLISRLYDVNDGAVFIDGVNVREIALADLRRQIGIVSQESYLFAGTVAENIAYAKPDASREEIIAAAKTANAHDFIMKLPDGYDTVIGKAGKDFSGGERQRLSIARAILHNPRILILDEATAAIDTQTEHQIQESLEKLTKGRTTISIAHRLSTLRNADRLMVMEEGKLIETGTHSELMRQKGAYHKMVQKQNEALKLIGVED